MHVLYQRSVGHAEVIDVMTQGRDEKSEYLQIVEVLRNVSTLDRKSY